MQPFFYHRVAWVGRDKRGSPMTIALTHGKSAAAAGRAAACHSSLADTASDDVLIRRIAAGDQLAIARYKALSARRARADAELDARIASSIADPADNPEAALQKRSRSEVLKDSLARLSPEHGEVIDLVYYHGKSVKEVADIVGIGEATVKTR